LVEFLLSLGEAGCGSDSAFAGNTFGTLLFHKAEPLVDFGTDPRLLIEQRSGEHLLRRVAFGHILAGLNRNEI
jgi:hypothetical protein